MGGVQRRTAIMNILYFVIFGSPVLSIDWGLSRRPDMKDQVGEKGNEDEFQCFLQSVPIDRPYSHLNHPI